MESSCLNREKLDIDIQPICFQDSCSFVFFCAKKFFLKTFQDFLRVCIHLYIYRIYPFPWHDKWVLNDMELRWWSDDGVNPMSLPPKGALVWRATAHANEPWESYFNSHIILWMNCCFVKDCLYIFMYKLVCIHIWLWNKKCRFCMDVFLS